jgi:hypothetical protein
MRSIIILISGITLGFAATSCTNPQRPALPTPSHTTTPSAIEGGFTHCCGDADYKLEIDCADNLLRCYEKTDQGWKYTYGRLCKQNLGSACYLNGCDDAC